MNQESSDIPEIIRQELKNTRPVTPKMLNQLAEANKKLFSDPSFVFELDEIDLTQPLFDMQSSLNELKARTEKVKAELVVAQAQIKRLQDAKDHSDNMLGAALVCMAEDGFSPTSQFLIEASEKYKRVKAELIELRKDKERLDWLEQHPEYTGWLTVRYSDLRSAIDSNTGRKK